MKPSAKAIQRLCRTIHAYTDRRWLGLDPAKLVARLNRLVRGWGNYFCLGTVAKAYRRVNDHLRYRLRQWWLRKHQRRGLTSTRAIDQYLRETLGVVTLRRQPQPYS